MITLLIKPGTYNEFDLKYTLKLFLSDAKGFSGVALKFRDHIAIIESDDHERIWFFKTSKEPTRFVEPGSDDQVIDYSSADVVTNKNGEAWILHHVYSYFRSCYTDFHSRNFPVEEIGIIPFYEFWVDFNFVRTDMLHLMY